MSPALRPFAALLGAAVLAAALPAPALADHREESRWRRHYGHHHGHHHHDAWCARDHGFGLWFAPRPRYARGVHYHHRPAPAYLCQRCGLSFSSYDALHGHVHHHHHVPAWRVPGAIAQVSFGFVFGD
jgi:hypothetical protein